MIKRYSPDAYSDAGGLLVETMSYDPNGEYIRVADLAQYASVLGYAADALERDAADVPWIEHRHNLLAKVDQLRALLAAVTGGNNEN